MKAENFIGNKWKETLTEEMILAGKGERETALAEGKLDEGIPAIDAVVDSGWSTRSHQHRYTVKSRVACVIGRRTKKILFIGVHNKFCSVCAIASGKKQEPPEHQCFKNWDGSSSSMEEDIVIDGFCQSEKQHG